MSTTATGLLSRRGADPAQGRVAPCATFTRGQGADALYDGVLYDESLFESDGGSGTVGPTVRGVLRALGPVQSVIRAS